MNYSSKLSEKPHRKIYLIFIFYISCYGTLSIFYDNSMFKISKEVFFIGLISISLYYIWLNNSKTQQKIISEIISILIIILLINYFFNSRELNFYIFAYGVKITVLPLMSIILGIYISLNKISIYKTLLIIWLMIIGVWLFQNQLGLNYLLNSGFKYGINVKHFFSDTLRLPSTVGTPDNYAFLLSLISCYLVFYTLKIKKYKTFVLYFLISFIFIFLSTIRSALLFYCIFIAISLLKTFYNFNKKYIYTLFIFISMILIVLLVTIPINPLISFSSSQERLQNWSSTVNPLFTIQGIVGNGLGTVGAADTKISLNTFDLKGNAVDNQYLALYEQVGIVGMILFFLLFIRIFYFLENKKENSISISLIIALMVCSLFTNVLELHPFNILFGIMIGMELRGKK